MLDLFNEVIVPTILYFLMSYQLYVGVKNYKQNNNNLTFAGALCFMFVVIGTILIVHSLWV